MYYANINSRTVSVWPGIEFGRFRSAYTWTSSDADSRLYPDILVTCLNRFKTVSGRHRHHRVPYTNNNKICIVIFRLFLE